MSKDDNDIDDIEKYIDKELEPYMLKTSPLYKVPSSVSPITPLGEGLIGDIHEDSLELPSSSYSDISGTNVRSFPRTHDTHYNSKRSFYNTAKRKEPVKSCGVICFLEQSIDLYKDTKNIQDIRILLVRRKDSLAYVEFIRGKYKPSDPMYIRSLLRSMTHEEHQKILTMEFEELWTDMWKSKITKSHLQEFTKSIGRFNECRNDIRDYLIKNPTEGEREPEWTFPKGRLNKYEKEFECASREFREETNILRENVSIKEESVLNESYTGTNGIRYTNYFYTGVTNIHHVFIHPSNLFQQKEISAIEWVSPEDADERIRRTYPSRTEILREAVSRILTNIE